MKVLRKLNVLGSPKSAATFEKAVQELAEKDDDAVIRIYQKSGVQGAYLSEMAIAEALEVSKSFEGVLKEEFGGGSYQVILSDKNTEVKGKYSFKIAGASKIKKESSEDEQPRKPNFADEWQRTLELAKALKGDSSDRELQREMFALALSSKENSLDDAMRVIELSKAIQPQVEQADPLTSIITSIGPVLGQIVAAKMSGAAPKLNTGQINELSQNLGMLQAQVNQLSAPALGGTQTPPPPKEVNPDAKISGTEITEETVAPPPEVNPHHESIDVIIDEIRSDLSSNVADAIIASKTIGLVQYARVFTADDPHPLLKGILEATEETLDEEFVKFCLSIPELAADPAKMQRIGLEILKITGEGAAQTIAQMRGAETPKTAVEGDSDAKVDD